MSDKEYMTLGEELPIVSDFLNRLAIGETVVTCSSSIRVWSGIDPTPSVMLVGTPTISGSEVTQVVTGGVAGVVYTLSIAARTSNIHRRNTNSHCIKQVIYEGCKTYSCAD